MSDEKGCCRVCGPNKGHSFNFCKNVRGLREIIKLQDSQIQAELDFPTRRDALQKRVQALEGQSGFQFRLITALLDSLEMARKGNGR